MTYVKLANRTHEQNLVAHQSGGNIYFTTNKLVMEGEELRLWYSKDYAQWQGKLGRIQNGRFGYGYG